MLPVRLLYQFAPERLVEGGGVSFSTWARAAL
jgi:hypothetical protein